MKFTVAAVFSLFVLQVAASALPVAEADFGLVERSPEAIAEPFPLPGDDEPVYDKKDDKKDKYDDNYDDKKPHCPKPVTVTNYKTKTVTVTDYKTKTVTVTDYKTKTVTVTDYKTKYKTAYVTKYKTAYVTRYKTIVKTSPPKTIKKYVTVTEKCKKYGDSY